MNAARILIVLTMLAPLASESQTAADTSARVSFGAFLDSYYAWDFNRPSTLDRSFVGGVTFTTQPARHNEFNVNLGYIEAKIDAPRIRGRIALQAGTSVQSNYSGEPSNGAVSGPYLARHLQEAFAGYKVSSATWIDAGIFYSHMGMESWASRDNPTYTRSLVAEYSPYYSSGLRVQWQATSRLATRVDVVNGWQNISESNEGKGVGLRLDYAVNRNLSVAYYSFFSREAGNRIRTFNGTGGKAALGRFTLLLQADVGAQARSAHDGETATWWGAAAVGRFALTPLVAIAGRAERYADSDQVIVATGLAGRPLNGAGGSIGLDVAPHPRLLWRTELRGFNNRKAVFLHRGHAEPRASDVFAVTSLAATF
jgi:hypothetical protein